MEAFIQLVFIIAGAICLFVGITKSMVALVIIGVILLAIGGVWLLIVIFDGGGGSGGGGSFFDFD